MRAAVTVWPSICSARPGADAGDTWIVTLGTSGSTCGSSLFAWSMALWKAGGDPAGSAVRMRAL